MHHAEIARAGRLDGLRRHHFTVIVIDGLVAERAPHALEGARIGIEDRDPVIAVAVCDEDLVRRRVHECIRWPMQITRVGVSLALVAAPDLQHQLAFRTELQKLIVRDRLETANAIGRAVIATQPHESLGVYVDAVLPLWPLIANSRAAPRLDEVTRLAEHHDRGCRHGRLLGRERARTMKQPDVVLRVDGEARRVTQFPFRRNFGPGGIDLERRNGRKTPFLGSQSGRLDTVGSRHQSEQSQRDTYVLQHGHGCPEMCAGGYPGRHPMPQYSFDDIRHSRRNPTR